MLVKLQKSRQAEVYNYDSWTCTSEYMIAKVTKRCLTIRADTDRQQFYVLAVICMAS